VVSHDIQEHTMKSNIARRAVELVALALAIATFTPSAFAQCSFTRAAGTYGISDSGTVVGIGPRAAVGTLTLDAAGNLNGEVTASLNGTILAGTLSGTYEVKSDCTGTASFTEIDQFGHNIAAKVSAVWDDNMRQLRFLFTSITLNGTPLGIVINGDGRKLVP
jgi:uncharacterized protein YdeI (BOF family)